MRTYLTLLFITTLYISSSAQFGNVLNRVTNRAVNKIENKLADELVNAAYRPVDRAIEEAFKEQHKEDSIAGKTNKDYSGYLAALTKTVEVADSYNFDVMMDVEIQDREKEKHLVQMFLTEDGKLFGIKQIEENTTVILDMDQDAMIMYNHSDMEVTAVPSIFTMASAFHASEENEDEEEINIEDTGKTKEIAGYKCQEYRVESESNKGKIWISKDFPMTWNESYGNLIRKINPKFNSPIIDGMLFKSDMKDKKTKDKSKMKVLEVDLEGEKFDSSLYKNNSISTD